jgi:hypothetical protein
MLSVVADVGYPTEMLNPGDMEADLGIISIKCRNFRHKVRKTNYPALPVN